MATAVTEIVQGPAPRTAPSARLRRPRTGFFFVAPSLAVVALLFVVPLGILVGMSFTDWPLLGDPTPAGAANYTRIPGDQIFVGAITFTLVYTLVTTVAIFGTAFALVAIANSRRRGSVLYRTAFFLPYVVGTVAASLLWFVDLNDQVGVFARILQTVGLAGAVGLDTPTRATLAVVALVVWKFVGFQVVVLLVGLQSVPEDVYEAARVDGASTWQRLRYITLPFLKPTLALLLVLSITGSLLAFDQFFVLTHGGPDNSTVTLVYAIYNTAFSSFELGRAAALSVVLLVALVVLNVAQLTILRSRED